MDNSSMPLPCERRNLWMAGVMARPSLWARFWAWLGGAAWSLIYWHPVFNLC